MDDDFQGDARVENWCWGSTRCKSAEDPLDSCSTAAAGSNIDGFFGWTPLFAGTEMADGNALGSFDNSPASCVTFQDSHILQPSDYMSGMPAMDSFISSLSPSSVDHGWPHSLIDESSEPYSFKDLSHGFLNMDPSSSEKVINNMTPFSPSGISLLDSFLGFEARPHQQEDTGELLTMRQQNFFTKNTTPINGISDIHSLLRPVQFMETRFEEKADFDKAAAKFIPDRTASLSQSSASKKPRIETPSPLPTFKVRKEKLGDRITALQQLVCPFGKTDTASVLYEAIEYIKFLHEQVRTLSSPYLINGTQIQHLQNSDRPRDSEKRKEQLRSRGLCLVPISSTFAVACSEIPPIDFWAPALGVSYI